MKMIPISEIDETIKDFKAIAKYDPIEDPITKYIANVVIPTLEQLRKKAIPAIPISKIDEKINSLEVENNYCYECGIDYQEYAKEILSDLKNEN